MTEYTRLQDTQAQQLSHLPAEERLRLKFSDNCNVHPSAFNTILLPGYRIMGLEWAERLIEGWSK